MTDIAQRVTQQAAEFFGGVSANDEMTFKDQGADSLDMVEWVMLLEEEFEFEINDDQAKSCINLKGSIDIVTQLAKPS